MGTPNSVIQPVQTVQNTATCLILRPPCYQNCTPLLQQLHWLPISYFAWKYIKTSLRCSKSNNDIQIQLRSKSNPTDQSISQSINRSISQNGPLQSQKLRRWEPRHKNQGRNDVRSMWPNIGTKKERKRDAKPQMSSPLRQIKLYSASENEWARITWPSRNSFRMALLFPRGMFADSSTDYIRCWGFVCPCPTRWKSLGANATNDTTNCSRRNRVCRDDLWSLHARGGRERGQKLARPAPPPIDRSG